jgi:DNA polymerase III subunit delta'
MGGGFMKNTTAETLDGIIGQQRAIGLLTRMVEKDRLPHALLFTGIDGIGKQTTAKAVAMTLNCLTPTGALACRECASCRKMLSGNHPDLIIVEPSGAFIKIDQIRTLHKQLMFAPIQGGRRHVIVNDAHAMNPEASNAMLKTLEEPPDNTHLVLTAQQTSDLLPTIVSRCRHLSFEPLSPEHITRKLLETDGVDETTAGIIALMARGSLGKALSVDSGQWLAWRKDLIEQIKDLRHTSLQTLFGFAQSLAHDKDRLGDALEIIMLWLRDLLMSKVHPEKVLNQDWAQEIQRKAQECTVKDLLTKITTVSSTQRAVSSNVNRQLALEVMALKLAAPGGNPVASCREERLP